MRFDSVFVDADSLLYSIGYATQRAIYYVWIDGHQGDPSIITSDKTWLNKVLKDVTSWRYEKYLYVQPFLAASVTIDQTVESHKTLFETQDVFFYFTGEHNYRDDIATIQPYKGNRDPSNKPAHYEALKAYMVKRHGAVIVEGQEADDEVAILQTTANESGLRSVIISIDKDLNMVEGWHYNPMKPEKERLYYVDAFEGQRWMYTQLLMGDQQVDNIPGLKGIGIKRAQKLLADCQTIEEMECIVGNKYAEHYDDPETAMIEVGQLLWMRTRKGEMWYPEFLGGCRSE